MFFGTMVNILAFSPMDQSSIPTPGELLQMAPGVSVLEDPCPASLESARCNNCEADGRASFFEKGSVVLVLM